MLPRRYQQRDVAIEIAAEFGWSAMLAFLDTEGHMAERAREAGYKWLVRRCASRIPRHHPALDAAAFQSWKKSVTKLWQVAPPPPPRACDIPCGCGFCMGLFAGLSWNFFMAMVPPPPRPRPKGPSWETATFTIGNI